MGNGYWQAYYCLFLEFLDHKGWIWEPMGILFKEQLCTPAICNLLWARYGSRLGDDGLKYRVHLLDLAEGARQYHGVHAHSMYGGNAGSQVDGQDDAADECSSFLGGFTEPGV